MINEIKGKEKLDKEGKYLEIREEKESKNPATEEVRWKRKDEGKEGKIENEIALF